MLLPLEVLTFFAAALSPGQEATPFEGRAGFWGQETMGLRCRVTTDKTGYAIGDPVRVLVEVRNTTDKPIALGLEPLIEVDKEGGLFRQEAEIGLGFSQSSQTHPGFSVSYSNAFPKGRGSDARAVVIEPKVTFSEIITTSPWGPVFGSMPSSAQPGTMLLRASLRQFLSPDLKKTTVESEAVTFNVKAAPTQSNSGGAANVSQSVSTAQIATEKEVDPHHNQEAKATALDAITSMFLRPDSKKLATLIDKDAQWKNHLPGSALEAIKEIADKRAAIASVSVQEVRFFTMDDMARLKERYSNVRLWNEDRVPQHLKNNLGCIVVSRNLKKPDPQEPELL